MISDDDLSVGRRGDPDHLFGDRGREAEVHRHNAVGAEDRRRYLIPVRVEASDLVTAGHQERAVIVEYER